MLVLSYPWLDKQHPDRKGEQLKRICPIFEAMLKLCSGGATFGVMLE